MELPDLCEIKKQRRKMGITQTELAKKAGISQSLIARVEAGNVDPRYSKVEGIFQALKKLKREEITASEIMSEKVVSVDSENSLNEAVELMKSHQVSQLPISNGDKTVGSISEEVVLSQISQGANLKNMGPKKTRQFMDESFPSVSPDAPLSTISKLLENNKAVLVKKRGSVQGIITNADLLKVMH